MFASLCGKQALRISVRFGGNIKENLVMTTPKRGGMTSGL